MPTGHILRGLRGVTADLLLDDSSSLLDDLGGGVGLPLPDVASPHWLGGMGPSNSDPGAAAGRHGRLGSWTCMWHPLDKPRQCCRMMHVPVWS